MTQMVVEDSVRRTLALERDLDHLSVHLECRDGRWQADVTRLAADGVGRPQTDAILSRVLTNALASLRRTDLV